MCSSTGCVHISRVKAVRHSLRKFISGEFLRRRICGQASHLHHETAFLTPNRFSPFNKISKTHGTGPLCLGGFILTLAARLCDREENAAKVYANVPCVDFHPRSLSCGVSGVRLRVKALKMSEEGVQQVVLPMAMTSSKDGTFYFAYGSNLSPSQMSLRLPADPRSSEPVAVARLDAHAWIICERGYANVVAQPETDEATDENVVWGLVYNLSAVDEARLDMFEGHDEHRNPQPQANPNPSEQRRKPYLQGDWDYNKHYLPVTVTKWLVDPERHGIAASDELSSIRVLVYVDELRTRRGKILQEYIGRMNRAIRESIGLGLQQSWVDAVMRQQIPAGIEVDDQGYVGTDKGYIEADATETASNLTEVALHDKTADRERLATTVSTARGIVMS